MMNELLLRRRVAGTNSTVGMYVQDGLIAMWDGIENAGRGKHTSDKTKMIELVSGNSASIERDVAWSGSESYFDIDCSVTEKGIATSANNKYVDITFPFNFNKNEWTLEMVQTIATLRNTNVTDAVSKALSWSDAFEVHHYNNQLRIKGKNVSEGRTGLLVTTGTNYFAISKDTSNKVVAYKNASQSAQILNSNYDLTKITGYIAFTNSGHHGIIHAFRIYDRVLSSAEILNNYNADKKRFEI